tara:strand:- start:1356 stop:2477 length:1122 start_codon:yes stop_codon:yes gene_type:complete
MPARKFLYVVAALIVLTLGSALAYRMWGQNMLNSVMMPSARFSAPNRISAEGYADRSLWLARPDISATNASLWRPKGVRSAQPGPVAIFYIHPTSYMATFNTARWNASLEDNESTELARRFTMTQASAFNSVGHIWAPRYHQAHFGAFLRKSEAGKKAIDAAYVEIEAAFAAFLTANPSGPIILAGHSQGSLHLMRLLKNRIAGEPVAQRIVAAYIVGWPVSMTADIPALGLPACESAEQAECILSWQSFAEPADTSAVQGAYSNYPGMTGKQREGTPMLCINPITGTPDATAAASANRGTLAPAPDDPTKMQIVKGAVGAACRDGFLMIGDPPQLGPFVLPGNNYHVYDYALFWANIRADAEKRLTTFLRRR